jgi:hypothetical protein
MAVSPAGRLAFRRWQRHRFGAWPRNDCQVTLLHKPAVCPDEHRQADPGSRATRRSRWGRRANPGQRALFEIFFGRPYAEVQREEAASFRFLTTRLGAEALEVVPRLVGRRVAGSLPRATVIGRLAGDSEGVRGEVSWTASTWTVLHSGGG